MSPYLAELQNNFILKFNQFADNYFSAVEKKRPEVSLLWESMRYSFESGGKRFRPFLVDLTTKAFRADLERTTLAYGLSTEMIHTYSLIHDDLPCMDNDDFRRNKPTNHKVYGDDIALLAGDGLLTEAFQVMATSLNHDPNLAISLIQLLSLQAGARGMIGGQVLDMKSQSPISVKELELMHRLKTGALIEACVMGGVKIASATAEQTLIFEKFATSLGLSFQIKDDILDAHDKDQDHKSYIAVLGLEKTQNCLQEQVEISLGCLNLLKDLNTQALRDLVLYNQNRQN